MGECNFIDHILISMYSNDNYCEIFIVDLVFKWTWMTVKIFWPLGSCGSLKKFPSDKDGY